MSARSSFHLKTFSLVAFLGESDTLLYRKDESDRDVLQFTLEMTRDIKVSDATFARASAAVGGAQKVVELVAKPANSGSQ